MLNIISVFKISVKPLWLQLTIAIRNFSYIKQSYFGPFWTLFWINTWSLMNSNFIRNFILIFCLWQSIYNIHVQNMWPLIRWVFGSYIWPNDKNMIVILKCKIRYDFCPNSSSMQDLPVICSITTTLEYKKVPKVTLKITLEQSYGNILMEVCPEKIFTSLVRHRNNPLI